MHSKLCAVIDLLVILGTLDILDHFSSFDSKGNPTDRQNNLMGSFSKLLVQSTRQVPEVTSGRIRGDDAHANFICYQD